MRTVSTDTFSFDVPDSFERVRPAWQSLRASRNIGDDDVDFTVGLADDDLRKHPGATPAERFRSACLERRGRVVLLSDTSLTVGDAPAHQVTARAEEGEYAYFFARVDIGGGFYLDAVGDCPAGQEDEHFPHFEQMLSSLRWFGDPSVALAIQREALGALFARQRDEEAAPAAVPAEAPPPFEIPADGEDVFIIGEIAFDLLPQPDAQLYAHSTTGSELLVNLRARARRRDEHLLNDYEHDEVYFNLSLSGVYQAGVPTAQVRFAAGRAVQDDTYLWMGGFHYRLSLSAQVVLRDGWIGISGTLDDSGGQSCYAVRIARRLHLDDLDGRGYRFTTPQELESAPPGLARHLMLRDPPGTLLPSVVLAQTGLRTLSVHYSSPAAGRAGLAAIPDEIAAWQDLRELSFVNVAGVREIPAGLGQLVSLTSLFISGTQAEHLPASVAALPALRRCFLGGNRLRALPDTFSPALEHLTLKDNALAIVPSSLAALPHLRSLDLHDNPLVSLPAGLLDLPALRLELDKKLALFDYRYPGAGGRGTQPVDDSLFVAREAQTLTDALAAHLGEPVWAYTHPVLRGLARQAVALATTEPDDYTRRGGMRFGGLPDLPPGMPYPSLRNDQGETRGMLFIAQLDCAALSAFQRYLPRTGILYFFLSDQETRHARVVHYQGELTALQSAADLIEADVALDAHDLHAPWRAEAGPWISLPHLWGDLQDTGAPDTLAALAEDADRMEALRAEVDEAGPVAPVHGINSYVFKQHDTPEREAADALRGRPEEFMVLLRVSSDSNPGFNFWDAGEIYFVIHKSDLAAGDFSNVFVGLESS